ncbi:molybdopterin-synthase adenylyltransferase MoeB [Croceitalea sp. MTPC9]|uniref:HesA/MoeB/ThiF family protein n=1 Tax=unclassified Croceitalea TaxID=2632280 RepID=UPI002B3EF366|nr:molybdopterin-synthase adenylyltransferase MoeB [Croceitalea sp. MTPC6]GMN15728.1 molybdopterin-synthase adenylyltransferase MoeB [Croceitalea sp. MTPC9]
MSKTERFIRQTKLSSFGVDNQSKLYVNQVLIVGLGGLGLPIAQYLNAMGVGTLGLIDQDVVELHNLQRQVLYSEADIGKSKLEVTKQKLEAQNSNTNIKSYDLFLTKENAITIIKDFDVIVDATDNFATRYLINDACVILNKPFVYGALHAFEGQVSVFNYNNGPTYRCLFPTMPNAHEIPNCNQNGVLGVLPGIIGTLQALEVVKIITGVGEVLSGKLLLFDGLTQSTQKVSFNKKGIHKNIRKLQDDYGFTGCEVVPTVSPLEFRDIQKIEEVVLIDVRNPDEFDTKHLKSAINIPLSELNTSMDKINFNKNIYLICQSGKRSEIALKQLTSEYPHSSIYHILGGMNEMASVCS